MLHESDRAAVSDLILVEYKKCWKNLEYRSRLKKKKGDVEGVVEEGTVPSVDAAQERGQKRYDFLSSVCSLMYRDKDGIIQPLLSSTQPVDSQWALIRWESDEEIEVPTSNGFWRGTVGHSIALVLERTQKDMLVHFLSTKEAEKVSPELYGGLFILGILSDTYSF